MGFRPFLQTAVISLVVWGAGCASHEKVVTSEQPPADSFVVHGRLAYANGNPSTRIWIVGTNRILGIREGEAPEDFHRFLNWDVSIYGDYTVIPLTQYRPGEMQIVKLVSAKNLVITKYCEPTKIVRRVREIPEKK